LDAACPALDAQNCSSFQLPENMGLGAVGHIAFSAILLDRNPAWVAKLRTESDGSLFRPFVGT
jgi:hypothetical protein